MVNGRCRMHGGKSPGAPTGNTNARKHGLYTADAIAERRELAALIRSMRGLVEELDELLDAISLEIGLTRVPLPLKPPL